MEYVKLGKSDLKVSRISLGAWQFGDQGWGWGTELGEKEALTIIDKALDLGVNLIDTAEIYGDGISERVVGKALQNRRSKAIIATKVWANHLRYNSVLKAAEGSLQRLGVGEIDLYQIHWANPLIPIRETMRAMEKLVAQGKIRYIGVSNFSSLQLRKAQEALSRSEIISNQVKYNMLQRGVERELFPYALKENIAIIAYSPLAQGLLTGKYTTPQTRDVRGVNPLFANTANFRKALGVVEVIRRIAERRGKTPSQVALNWLLKDQPIVVPIPGAKSLRQLEDNMGGMNWRLSLEEAVEIDAVTRELKFTRLQNPLHALSFLKRRALSYFQR